jgi:hypothetical protein
MATFLVGWAAFCFPLLCKRIAAEYYSCIADWSQDFAGLGAHSWCLFKDGAFGPSFRLEWFFEGRTENQNPHPSKKWKEEVSKFQKPNPKG